MSVLPVELERISTNTMRARRFCRRSVHRQQRRSFHLWLPCFPALRLSLIDARRARTRIAQPREVPPALVPVLPVDLETRSFCDLHPNLVRSDRNPRKLPIFKTLARLFFLADEANSFVTHASILVPDSCSTVSLPCKTESGSPVGNPSILTTFFCFRYSFNPSSPFDCAQRRSVSRSPA